MQGDEALGIGKHVVRVLDELVGRKPAVGLAHVHGAPRGDDAHAELPRRLDLRLDEAGLPAREDVVVVERCRTAAEREHGETGARGGVLRIAVDPLPERIEGAEPVKRSACCARVRVSVW